MIRSHGQIRIAFFLFFAWNTTECFQHTKYAALMVESNNSGRSVNIFNLYWNGYYLQAIEMFDEFDEKSLSTNWQINGSPFISAETSFYNFIS